MRFKVMCGSFSMADRLYKAGDVVETSYLLDKMFPKKYKRIDGFVSNIREDAADVVPETDEWENGEARTGVMVIENEEEVEVDEKQTKHASGPKHRPAGKDVSKEFDYSQEETGLVIYRDKGKFFVYDEDDLVTPLNENPLTKAKIAGFIKSQCE